jgi:IS5 family transposase
MDSFTAWTLRRLSEEQGTTRLSRISKLIDWNPIRKILDEMYNNKTERGEGPTVMSL